MIEGSQPNTLDAAWFGKISFLASLYLATLRAGAASWNLVTRNGQEVVSGIYLYTVQSDDPAFEDYHGRFVVIR